MPRNPFTHRGPIRQAEDFFGREREISRAFALLGNMQNVAIIGQRRIGKSSLLLHLCRPEVFTKHGIPEQKTVFAYVDGQELSELDEGEVRGFLAQQLAAALGDDQATSDKPGKLAHQDLRRFIERLAARESGAIILLDEFEALAVNPGLAPRFFSGLRALSSQFDLAFVTASHHSLFDLTYARSDTLSSPFFNTFAELRLGLFSESASQSMLETMASGAGLSLPEELVLRILALAGPHPFLLQMAAFHACESLAEIAEGSDAWEHRFRTEASPHFAYYWDHLSDEEQIALATLPFAQGTDTPALRSLAHASLIRRDSERWIYLCPALEQFVRHQSLPGLLQFGPFIMDLEGRRATGSEGPLKVTKTEFDALAFLIRNAGRVVPPEELEKALWAEEYVEDPERVRSVIKSLRKALGDDSGYLATKWGEGYILQPPA